MLVQSDFIIHSMLWISMNVCACIEVFNRVSSKRKNCFLVFMYNFLVSISEAVTRRCSVKKVFLEISQNSQENTCARASFLISKKRLWHSCFPVNFVKFLSTTFFIELHWWLLLYKVEVYCVSKSCKNCFMPFLKPLNFSV